MEWLKTLITDYLPLISDNRLIQAALIFLLASIISSIAKFILNRLQLHGAGRTHNPVDDHLFSLLRQPVSLSILLVGIHLAVSHSQLIEEYVGLLGSVLASVAIFYWSVLSLALPDLP